MHEVTIETWLKKIGEKHIEVALRIAGMDSWSRAMPSPSSMTHPYAVALVDLYMSVSASLSFSCVELQDGISAVHGRRAIFPTDTADTCTIFEKCKRVAARLVNVFSRFRDLRIEQKLHVVMKRATTLEREPQ